MATIIWPSWLKEVNELIHSGKHVDAESSLTEIIKKSLRQSFDQALAYQKLAYIHYVRFDKEKFFQAIFSAKELSRDYGHNAVMADVLALMGIYYQQTEKNLIKAEEYYIDALKIKQSLFLESSEELIPLQITMATLTKEQGKFWNAVDMLRGLMDSVKELTKQGNPRYEICVRLELARVYNAQDNLFQDAINHLNAAIVLASDKFPSEQGDIFREKGRILLKQDKTQESLVAYQAASRIYTEYGYEEKKSNLEKEIESVFSLQ